MASSWSRSHSFKETSRSKTIFIIVVMKRERKEERIWEKREGEEKKITKRGGRSGQGGGSRLAREIYSRQPALCHHQRSPCVLSTLRYCGRFPLVREAEEKSAASFFTPPRTTIRTPLPPSPPQQPPSSLSIHWIFSRGPVITGSFAWNVPPPS